MREHRVGRLIAMQNVARRSREIEQLVRQHAGCEDADAADMAHDAVMEAPGRSNAEIAREIAGRIGQP